MLLERIMMTLKVFVLLPTTVPYHGWASTVGLPAGKQIINRQTKKLCVDHEAARFSLLLMARRPVRLSLSRGPAGETSSMYHDSGRGRLSSCS